MKRAYDRLLLRYALRWIRLSNGEQNEGNQSRSRRRKDASLTSSLVDDEMNSQSRTWALELKGNYCELTHSKVWNNEMKCVSRGDEDSGTK